MQVSVLHIGDQNGVSALLATAQKAGLECISLPTPENAIELLSSKRIELIFLSAEADIAAFFTSLSSAKISVPTVVYGKAQPAQNAVKAIRLGAIEYLSTPLEEKLVEALLEKITPQQIEASGPIAGDDKTRELLIQAKQFAASNASIFLRGESGTGKEVFSRFIHDNSLRSKQPFIAVNCAAIPENLLESELFGHEKGAFSGAVAKRMGKFQQASGGTLLLDEISEMDLSLQSKLLRAIQEQVIDPVGSDKPVTVDIRLIATTNRKLEDYVAEGKFREDLYFRLNVVALEIPSLRERIGDIMPLAAHFAAKYGAQNGKENITFSAAAREKLETCYWKGNVRELENTLHRAVLMLGALHEIAPEHIIISPMSLDKMAIEPSVEQAAQAASQGALPQSAAAAQHYAAANSEFAAGSASTTPQPMLGKSLASAEKEFILSTLNYCQGNREKAADVLGISIKILAEKLSQYQSL